MGPFTGKVAVVTGAAQRSVFSVLERLLLQMGVRLTCKGGRIQMVDQVLIIISVCWALCIWVTVNRTAREMVLKFHTECVRRARAGRKAKSTSTIFAA